MFGSPERCLFRAVIEDDQQGLYLLENISPEVLDTKNRIHLVLKFLHGNGLHFINPYITDVNGEGIVYHQGAYWQMCRFITGVDLVRPHYVFDGWRSDPLMEILNALSKVSDKMTFLDAEGPFSIKTYIYALLEKLVKYEPVIHERVLPIVDFLEKQFMTIHDHLPKGFCHGDLHPLNMIWSERGIKAVIDWEFTGYKPEIYDLALLVGCLGVEDPDCLTEPLVQRLLHRIQKEEIYDPLSLVYLAEFAIAIRFAWLAEWLRIRDHEMIALECDYMDLLLDNIQILKHVWELTV
jgi:homoserine kinase type II